ncbi:15292_t:CDS:2, partial [Gigaspora rosea]
IAGLIDIVSSIINYLRTPSRVHVNNEEETEDIQSIIPVGRRTGSSKSTLANVLSGGENFAEIAGSSIGIGNTSELSNDEKNCAFSGTIGNCQKFEEKKTCDEDIKNYSMNIKKKYYKVIKNSIHVDNPSIQSPHYRDGA